MSDDSQDEDNLSSYSDSLFDKNPLSNDEVFDEQEQDTSNSSLCDDQNNSDDSEDDDDIDYDDDDDDDDIDYEDDDDEEEDDYFTFKSTFDDHAKLTQTQLAENNVRDTLAKQKTDRLLQHMRLITEKNKQKILENIVDINTLNSSSDESNSDQLNSPNSSIYSSNDYADTASDISKHKQMDSDKVNNDNNFINSFFKNISTVNQTNNSSEQTTSSNDYPVVFKIMQLPITNDIQKNNIDTNNDDTNNPLLNLLLKTRIIQQIMENNSNEDLPHSKKQCTESDNSTEKPTMTCDGINKCLRKNCNYNCGQLLSLINTELISMNEVARYHKLSRCELEKILEDITKIINTYGNDKNKLLLMRILESNMPDRVKNLSLELVKEIVSAQSNPILSGSHNNDKQKYLNGLLDIPFGIYKNIPVNKFENSIDECCNFLLDVYNNLNKTVYGMNNAKMQVCQIVSSLMSNKHVKGLVIGLHGPAGTGKTSLIKNGLSKSLNIPMEMFPLGGIKDGSTLTGKMSTYVNSKHGSILTALKKSKCMNPILYFDELDKVDSSNSQNSNDIENVLIHLTDPIQNDTFKDEYYDGIEFDLSKTIIVFSYNDESKINPILLDRILKIEVNGYNKKEMVIIAQDYLIPELFLNYGIDKQKLTIPNSVIEYIHDNYTPMEKGVRPIKQYLSHLITFVNTLSYLPKPSMLGEHLQNLDDLNFKYPLVMTKEMVKRIIGNTGELRQKIGLSEVAKSMFI